MMKFLLGLFAFIFSFNTYSQIDNVGSGRGITLDGVSNYVQIGNYKNINLPFTISAWVYLDPSATGANPIFVTNDNNVTYHGIIFDIGPTFFACEYGDGLGGNNPAFRYGKAASISNVAGRWVHVCAVMASYSEISLYFNGIDVASYSYAVGSSTSPMASSNAGELGKIGYLLSNNNSTSYFKGSIDEVRLYNRALSQVEVQQTMCIKLTGNENGLVGYWNFNETNGTTAIDNSSAKQNGSFVGNVQRVFSGAAIGDNSDYQYTANWLNNTFSLQDGNDQVSVSNVQGNPEGVQIYEVKNLPSQIGGLDASQVIQPYFGVYVASLDGNNTFNTTYSYQGVNSCKTFVRSDNSVATWVNAANPVINVLQRTEIIKANGVSAKVDLGPNQTLCSQTTSTTIATGLNSNQYSFLWNTGQITSSITVNQSGEYWVEVTSACGSVKDSVKILFGETPPPTFSLGVEKIDTLCKFIPVTLKPFQNSSGYQFIWQDNSTDSLFKATTFGKYWVTVKNNCGQSSDTIEFLGIKKPLGLVPNAITPNGDGFNDVFKIDKSLTGDVSFRVINRWGKEVYNSSTYNNDWDGGNLDSGVYYFVVSGGCVEEHKSWLSIIR